MLFESKVLGTVGYLGGLMAVPEPFTWCWGNMIAFNAEQFTQEIKYTRSKVSFHAHARNSLAKVAEGEFLLQLDTDIEFEPDILVRMVDRMMRHNIDVLTGVYVTKHPPHHPVLYHHDGKKFRNIGDWSSDIVQVDGAGGGVLCVRNRVFKRIENELGDGPFSIIPPYGEDLSFFERLRELDIKSFCDTRIQVGHLGLREYNLDDFDTSVLAEKVKVHGA